MTIENTTDRDPALHLLGMMGNASYITDLEAAGQRQLVQSSLLPVDGSHDPEFAELGFTFGDPDRRDPLFRPASLPAGWTREGSDHAMWSYVLDEHGRRRVGIFYKAAPYDRRASMNLQSVTSYLWDMVHVDGRPVLDDKWLTAEKAVEALTVMAFETDKDAERAAAMGHEYWDHRAAKDRALADKIRALAATVKSDHNA